MDGVKPSLTLNTRITDLFRAELGKFDYYVYGKANLKQIENFL